MHRVLQGEGQEVGARKENQREQTPISGDSGPREGTRSDCFVPPSVSREFVISLKVKL